jgi:hypothetical protein
MNLWVRRNLRAIEHYVNDFIEKLDIKGEQAYLREKIFIRTGAP